MCPERAAESPAERAARDLESAASMINALEVSARSEFERGTVRVLRALIAQQEHLLAESEHHKKAMDLMLEQIFRAQARR